MSNAQASCRQTMAYIKKLERDLRAARKELAAAKATKEPTCPPLPTTTAQAPK